LKFALNPEEEEEEEEFITRKTGIRVSEAQTVDELQMSSETVSSAYK